ncbi:TPA: hypothetical protein ENX78_02045 [Candidatus Poribacteria bacterium]|nr:hypothetical protein [Candidatus Poribacteria bacterium]
MRKIVIFICFILISLLSLSSQASTQIGIDEILFAPSSFLTATKDNLIISAYLRTKTKEGKTPEDFQGTVENSERFLSFQIREWGATFGWSGGKGNDIMSPEILAIDYKLPFSYRKRDFGFALDLKYSTKKDTKSTLRKSLLDFGVVSITGITEREISWILNVYGGLTANYVYIDMASDVLTDEWGLVPFLGVRVNVSPYYTAQIVSEINRAKIDSAKDAVWTWHFGISLGF